MAVTSSSYWFFWCKRNLHEHDDCATIGEQLICTLALVLNFKLFNPLKPEFTILTFTHYNSRLVVDEDELKWVAK